MRKNTLVGRAAHGLNGMAERRRRAPRLFHESVKTAAAETASVARSKTDDDEDIEISRKSAVELVSSLYAGNLRAHLRSIDAADLKSTSDLLELLLSAVREEQALKEEEEMEEMQGKMRPRTRTPAFGPESCIIHSVAVAEFDELKGNTLSSVYPSAAQPKIESHTESEIAELCLPDGAHRVPRDVSYMILRADDGSKLYGVSMFSNVPDASQKRGARQFALLLIAKSPRFDLQVQFEMILSSTTKVFLARSNSPVVLRELYDSLRDSRYPLVHNNAEEHFVRGRPVSADLRESPLVLFGSRIQAPIPIRSLTQRNHFGGASLVSLVRLLGESTMVLWSFVVMERRVMFAGGDKTTAREVGQLCIAAPLLVNPLVIEAPVPYVSLADTEPVTRKTYVCGAMNALFATKEDWFDVVFEPGKGEKTAVPYSTSPAASAELSKLGLPSSGNKVGGKDHDFIRSVMTAMDGKMHGDIEHWVRGQFQAFTQRFISDALERAEDTEIKSSSDGMLSGISNSGANFAKRALRTLGRGATSEKILNSFTAGTLFRSYVSQMHGPDRARAMQRLQVRLLKKDSGRSRQLRRSPVTRTHRRSKSVGGEDARRRAASSAAVVKELMKKPRATMISQKQQIQRRKTTWKKPPPPPPHPNGSPGKEKPKNLRPKISPPPPPPHKPRPPAPKRSSNDRDEQKSTGGDFKTYEEILAARKVSGCEGLSKRSHFSHRFNAH